MSGLDRRGVLALGGAAVAAGVVPAAAAARRARGAASGMLVFDPSSAEARATAANMRGHRLVALEGDPVRLWRAHLAEAPGPLHGVTRWSDYLILRGLAEERGQRLRSEARVVTTRGPMIVRWSMA